MKQNRATQFVFASVLSLSASLASQAAQAAPISVGNIHDIYVADTLLGSSSSAACELVQNQANCDFLTPTPVTYLDNNALEAVVADNDPASYVLAPFRNSASMDLGFSSVNLYNGDGNDLVIFNVGNNTSLGVDVFSDSGALILSDTFFIPADGNATVKYDNGDWVCVNGTDNQCSGGAALSAIFIDFEDSLAGDIAIGSIRINMGEDFNGPQGTRPRFSLAGGFHTAPISEVPLPLPAWLMLSGLIAMGAFKRGRK